MKFCASYATSSESLEQSFPAAAFSSCKITDFSPARLSGTNTCKFSSPGICTCRKNKMAFGETFRNSCTGADNVNSAAISSILAKPRSSFSARLVSITDLLLEYLISSDAVLSSALAQNSSQLSCRPESRNFPVDFSSIPAISLKQKENGEKHHFHLCTNTPFISSILNPT
uniref:Uncharacterized protein n=1 Tax=Chelonoidis abingdonii TaxID=106734 RepID=A0A8C0J9C7_CHEAB